MLRENSLSRHWFSFWVDETCGRGCSKPFKPILKYLQTVPEGTATDLLWFLSGLPVSLHWGRTACQAVDLIHRACNLMQGAFQVFHISSYRITYSSRWSCTRSTPIPVWTSSDFTMGENRLSSHGFWFSLDWTWSRWSSQCVRSFPAEFRTFTGGTATDVSSSHLNSQGLYVGGEHTVTTLKARILTLNGWNLRQGPS